MSQRLTGRSERGGTSPALVEVDGLPRPHRGWAALAVWLATAMSVLDGAIANLALPTLASRFGVSPADSVWVVNAYQLSIVALLFPLAALGDWIGYRRLYLCGLSLFTVSSGLCALAGNLDLLIMARTFQGVGAAAIMSINTAIVRAIYPCAMLGRGIGYNALVISVSAGLGPSFAAAILSLGEWRWLFAVNIPVGVAALTIGARFLPAAQGNRQPPDFPSAALSALAFGSFVVGAETCARNDFAIGAPLFVIGLVSGAALVQRSRDRPSPLLPLDLLRKSVFSLSAASSMASFAAQMIAFVALPFLLQNLLSRTVVVSGLLMASWPIAAGLMAPIAGRLADRYSAGLLGGIGLALLGIGLLVLARIDASSTNTEIAWQLAICGLGFGLFQSPNNRAMIAAAPRPRSGAAGGTLATARLLGQTSGAAVVAAGFHHLGVGAGPLLLRLAAGVAVLAAFTSVVRLRASISADGDAKS